MHWHTKQLLKTAYVTLVASGAVTGGFVGIKSGVQYIEDMEPLRLVKSMKILEDVTGAARSASILVGSIVVHSAQGAFIFGTLPISLPILLSSSFRRPRCP